MKELNSIIKELLMNSIPSGWILTEIGKVAEIVTGNTPPKNISK